jgi:hypothetical protein
VPVALDPNPANNCRGYEVALVDPYFDLRLEVIPPSQGDFCACPPTPRTYRVRVWNDGNAAYVPGSAPAQFQTALCRDPGCDDYDTPALPGGVQIRLINQTIEPHQSATYIISYPICGALCNRNQYLKAKINFGDLCTTGNCDEVAVPVVCSPCN